MTSAGDSNNSRKVALITGITGQVSVGTIFIYKKKLF